MMGRIVKAPAERRREIVAMAQKMFLEKEYEATSLNDVVSALGVAKGTIYHYFKSKEELLGAVVANMTTEFLEMVKSKMGEQQGDALAKLKKLSLAVNVASEWQNTVNQLHQPGNMGLHVRLLAALVQGLAPMMAEIIVQGCEEGVFKCSHPFVYLRLFCLRHSRNIHRKSFFL